MKNSFSVCVCVCVCVCVRERERERERERIAKKQIYVNIQEKNSESTNVTIFFIVTKMETKVN
jgi:hypothetical protein